MPLSALLEGDFFNTYIKSGNYTSSHCAGVVAICLTLIANHELLLSSIIRRSSATFCRSSRYMHVMCSLLLFRKRNIVAKLSHTIIKF